MVMISNQHLSAVRAILHKRQTELNPYVSSKGGGFNRFDTLIVISEDVEMGIGPEIDFTRGLLHILSKNHSAGVVGLRAAHFDRIQPLLHKAEIANYLGLGWRTVAGQGPSMIGLVRSYRGTVIAIGLPVILETLVLRKVFGTRMRIVGPLYGQPQSTFLRGIHRCIVLIACKKCDIVLYDRFSALGSFITRFAKQSVPFLNVVLPELPAQCSRTTSRKRFGLEGVFVAGLVGPFTGRRIASLEYALKNLHKFHKNVVIMAIGEIRNREKFRNPRLVVTGHVPNLLETMSALDCLLIPRLISTGSPMSKMIYGMFLGLPVVTNNTENLKVVSGRDAIVAELDELPAEVNRLSHDPDLAGFIGANAKSFIHRIYSEQEDGVVDRFVG